MRSGYAGVSPTREISPRENRRCRELGDEWGDFLGGSRSSEEVPLGPVGPGAAFEEAALTQMLTLSTGRYRAMQASGAINWESHAAPWLLGQLFRLRPSEIARSHGIALPDGPRNAQVRHLLEHVDLAVGSLLVCLTRDERRAVSCSNGLGESARSRIDFVGSLINTFDWDVAEQGVARFSRASREPPNPVTSCACCMANRCSKKSPHCRIRGNSPC